MNDYASEILRVLMISPQGLPAMKISKHVFNACNSMFNPLNYDEVHKEVISILQKWSKDTSSNVERAETRGYYRIRKNNEQQIQLMFNFTEETENKEEEQPTTETQELSLF